MSGKDEEEIRRKEEGGVDDNDYDGDDYVQAGCDFLIHWP